MDLVGIEPTTSSMPWKRAPSCATGPLCKEAIRVQNNCGSRDSILAYHEAIVKRAGESARSIVAIHDPVADDAAVRARSSQLRSGGLSLRLRTASRRAGTAAAVQSSEICPSRVLLNHQKSVFWGRPFLMTSMFSVFSRLLLMAIATAAMAQSASPAQANSPVPYASVSELNMLLSQVDQASQNMQADLAKLRIEKWKTDSNTKRGTQGDVDSVQRNLQTALPEMISQLKSSPESLPATFKLYRNLDALYDVFTSVVESAGAFGSKDEYQSLQNDLTTMETARRGFAARMETLSTSKEQEVTHLRTQLHDLQAATAVPPKKVVVDDTEPSKSPVKNVKKKTPAKKPSPSTATQSSTGQTTTPPAPVPQTP